MNTINPDKFVHASYWRTWNMGFFRTPKVRILCGNKYCTSEFETRSLHPFRKNKRPHGIVACCPHCGFWNWMDLEFT